jgi:hypothetical protein
MKNQGTALLPDDLHLRAQVLQCIFDVRDFDYKFHYLLL